MIPVSIRDHDLSKAAILEVLHGFAKYKLPHDGDMMMDDGAYFLFNKIEGQLRCSDTYVPSSKLGP